MTPNPISPDEHTRHLTGVNEMTPTYDEFVNRLTSRPQINLQPEQVDLLHAAIGLATESGEILDATKKHLYYGKPLDRANIIEELGDLEFYASMLRSAVAVSRDEVLERNINKLMVRYPGGAFDAARALNRDLTSERKTLEH